MSGRQVVGGVRVTLVCRPPEPMERTRGVGPVLQELMRQSVLSVVVVPVVREEVGDSQMEVIEVVVRVVHQTYGQQNATALEVTASDRLAIG